MLKKFSDEMQELESKGETVRIKAIDGKSYDGKISKAGEDYVEVSHEKGSHLIYFHNIISVSIIAKEVEWGSSIFEKIKGKKKN
jgi:hypothetical protein